MTSCKVDALGGNFQGRKIDESVSCAFQGTRRAAHGTRGRATGASQGQGVIQFVIRINAEAWQGGMSRIIPDSDTMQVTM